MVSRQDFVEFVNVNKFPYIAKISHECITGQYSPAVIWRVYLPDILPLEKAIVCDADLIFLFYISEIWNTKLDNSAIAAVLRTKPRKEEYHSLIKTPPSRYFRMTVTIMNLNHMRTNKFFLAERDNFLLYKLPQINKIARLNEQSLFNYFFSSSCIPFDLYLGPSATLNINSTWQEVEGILNRLKNEKRIVLDIKGWRHRSPFDYFYWSYLLLTPFHNEAYKLLQKHQKYYSYSSNLKLSRFKNRILQMLYKIRHKIAPND